MYIVNFINELGQSYTYYGLLESFRTKDDYKNHIFEDIKRARKYSLAFIRRYPHVIAEISKDNTVIETIQNDEYRRYKDEKDQQWKETSSKMHKVSNYIFYSFLISAGFLLTLIIHFMGVSGYSIYMKLLITPLLIVLFWKISNYVFTKYL